jgi:hypothetical protein
MFPSWKTSAVAVATLSGHPLVQKHLKIDIPRTEYTC